MSTSNGVGKFLSEHWVTLVAWLVGMGVMYGVTTTRLSSIERGEPEKTKWRVDAMEKRQDTTDQTVTKLTTDVAQIKASQDVMNTKIDYLVEAEKRRQQQSK